MLLLLKHSSVIYLKCGATVAVTGKEDLDTQKQMNQ